MKLMNPEHDSAFSIQRLVLKKSFLATLLILPLAAQAATPVVLPATDQTRPADCSFLYRNGVEHRTGER